MNARSLVAAAILFCATSARADPFQLREDALVYTQGNGSPVGYVALSGEDKLSAWASTEAVIWAGNGSIADALVFLVRLHHPKNWGELRLGRMIVSAGAVRPIHIDGADGRVRFPTGTSVEMFGGVPVVPQFQYGAWDWVVGGRAAQSLGRSTTLGVSYLQQRDDGRLAYEEVGIDFVSAPTRWFDLASHAAYDLVDPGVSEARVSLAGKFGPVRPELFALHRSPSRLLPATSLFSALGDAASDSAGLTLQWRMFPRLDVVPIVAARTQDGEAGIDATFRATLRLDDAGRGAISLDLRRQGAGTDPWTGVRLAARVPLARQWQASTELELVVPDDDSPDPAVRLVQRARGTVWPWGLAAITWMPTRHLQVAGAVEAASTPTNLREINALMRVTLMWGGGS